MSSIINEKIYQANLSDSTTNDSLISNEDLIVQKIKDKFTNVLQQEIFIQSFNMFIKYKDSTDYIINLDEVWEWLGFSTKGHAKRKLETCLHPNVDYEVFTRSGKNLSGGRPTETMMLKFVYSQTTSVRSNRECRRRIFPGPN